MLEIQKQKILLKHTKAGVVVTIGDKVYLTYKGTDENPHRMREFTIADADAGRKCLLLSAAPDVPAAKSEPIAQLLYPLTDSHDGYTFMTRVVGRLEPKAEGEGPTWIIQSPRPETVRKIANRRAEIRVTAKWPGSISWQRNGAEAKVGVTIQNLSFGGCCVSIATDTIQGLRDFDYLFSLFVSDTYSVSMEVPEDLREKPKKPDENPYAGIKALVRFRAPKVQDGRQMEIIALEFIHERQAINHLVTAIQRRRAQT